MSYVYERSFVVKRKLLQFRAKLWLNRHPDLKQQIKSYSENSEVTGCNVTDYWVLWNEIRAKKPREVLELGTGVSSLIIAHALMENEEETGYCGRLTSMEESPLWKDKAVSLLPSKYQKIVDIYLSGTQEDLFSFFRGVSYSSIPSRSYDFVFIDGPTTKSPVDGAPLFDIDFLNIIRNSEHPVSGIVDKRVSTCFVLQQVLGPKRVKYDSTLHIGFLNNCSKSDLGRLPFELSSANFNRSFKLFGQTKLGMNRA